MSRYNLKGWNLKDWFFGNGKSIKELAKVLVPLAITWVITNSPAWTAAVTIVGKLVLDTLEYYIKE
jgi:hypothetical protein